LTGALGVLKNGFVIVGSVPTTDGTSATVQPGSLLILDSSGNVVLTLTDSALLDSPWGLAVNDQGDQAQLFVSNVRSGTVTRIDLGIPMGGTPFVEQETRIASGYAHRTDPAALLVGPAGLAFDAARDILYVASTADNAIYAIPMAAVTGFRQGKGNLVVRDDAHLHGPIGLTLAPNGDLIVSNGDAVNPDPNQLNELDEFTPEGRFVGQFQLDTGAAGAAFGIAVSSVNGELRFAAVDDNTNSVDVWTFREQSRSLAKASGFGDFPINPDDQPSSSDMARAGGGAADVQAPALDALVSGGGLNGPSALTDQEAMNEVAMSLAGDADLFSGATGGAKKKAS
jgi:sugar lactone lactonase YvrE